MIESKAVLTGIYILFLLSVLLLPYAALAKGGGIRHRPLDIAFLCALAAVIVVFLLSFGSWQRVIISVLLALPFAFFIARSRGAPLWGSILGFAIFSTVVWWSASMEFLQWRIVPFWCLGALAIWILRQSTPMSPQAMRLALALVLIAGVGAHLLVAPFLAPIGLATAWHHWGVYVTTAKLLSAGAVPFVDFPLQYGLGPSVSMALACQPDCWKGAYFVTSLANLTYLMVLSWGAGRLMANSPRGLGLLAIAGVAVSVLVWTVYPPELVGPLATPSTSGLRFWPLAALLIFIIASEVNGRPAGAWGHALWALSMLWSPEAAIFACMVWWPYLLLVHVTGQKDLTLPRFALAAVSWVSIMICAILTLTLVFSLIFWAVFGQFPTLNGYLMYILNPPGPLPATLGGTVWILVAALALAGVAMFGADIGQTRILAASMMATIAVTTYYLSRSHDNNILNLFPFIAVTLICALRTKLPDGLAGFGKTILFGMVVWPAFFGINAMKEGLTKGASHPSTLSEVWNLVDMQSPQSLEILNAFPASAIASVDDLSEAVQTLRQLNQGVPVIINIWHIMLIDRANDVWTTMLNPASYAILPREGIRQFIAQGKTRFNKPGWIILQHDPQGMVLSDQEWLDLFATSYTIGETRDFGRYTGYLMVPK